MQVLDFVSNCAVPPLLCDSGRQSSQQTERAASKFHIGFVYVMCLLLAVLLAALLSLRLLGSCAAMASSSSPCVGATLLMDEVASLKKTLEKFMEEEY